MSTNEGSLDDVHFFNLLRTALRSAKKHTSLEPYLIYDGGENDQLEQLKKEGMCVLYRELSMREEIEEFVWDTFSSHGERKAQEMVNVRTGGFLRSEIPVAMNVQGMKDKYILYTDCDVLFMEDPDLDAYKPRYFAACGRKEGGYTRFHIGGWMHYNSGVMIMNVDSLYKKFDDFKDFILNDGYGTDRPGSDFWKKNLMLSDQVAYNLYFRGKIDDLPLEYNWNPSFGINDNANIIHFYGPKWTQWEDYLSGNMRSQLAKMIDNNRKSYEHYVKIAKDYKTA